MKKLRMAFPLCIAILLSLPAFSQQFTSIKSEYENGDYWHVIYALNNKIICLEYASPHSAFNYNRNYNHTNMVVLDDQLKVIKENELEALEKKKLITTYTQNNELYACYQDKKNMVGLYQINADNNTATLKENLFTARQDDYTMYSGESENKKYFFIMYRTYESKESGTYDLQIFDEHMKAQKTITFHDKHTKKQIALFDIEISDEGILYMVTNYRPAPNDYMKYELTTVRSEKDITTIALPTINEDLKSVPSWKLKGNKLAWISTQNGLKELSNVYWGSYDLATNTMDPVKNIEMVQPITNKASLENIIWAKDGSVYLYYDQLEFWNWGTGNHTGTDFGSFDGYAMKINTDYTMAWQHTIAKNQFENMDRNYSGTICNVDSTGNMHLFFLDLLQNTSVSNEGGKKPDRLLIGGKMPNSGVAYVCINKDGKAEKHFASKDETDVHHLSLDSYKFKPGQLVYTAFNIKTMGRSTYKIGKINWK
ncbi:hypothetical protein [Chitinophaga sp. Cy-1792]|uniref:hypothetical protein n=1 Tax=Chitinophaga sp. Cy-1792 TaxID=2608339 RepID=UPI001422CDEA|nr:hypothetical protein [Chitinophaga sp. Cy-1792]NIG54703.1 hypothetical protein [Chitinophaga sp. Cy-1792]